MDRWIIYLKERFPLPTYVLLSLGFSISGAYLTQSHWQFKNLIASFIGLMLFFFELRLMDELKDYAKDQVAHPTRPLPRQLISVKEVRHCIHLIILSMLIYGLIIYILLNPYAGILYSLISIYLWLMYREFYLGTWLSSRPFSYGLTHQIIIIPICLFCVSVHQQGNLLISSHMFAYCSCVLGAFFTYEICRKLNPQSHPILKTYLLVCGRTKTSLTVMILTLLAGASALGSGTEALLWPIEVCLIISLSSLFWWPERFKLTESLATLSLALHIWSIPIHYLLRSRS